MRTRVVKGILLMVIGTLVGCTQSADSVTTHTRSYVFKSKDDFSPNFTTQISNTIQLMKPVFQEYYQDGQKDRQAGMSREQALVKVDTFKKEAASKEMASQQTFVNQTTNGTLDKKRQLLFINEAMGAYLDGFDGR